MNVVVFQDRKQEVIMEHIIKQLGGAVIDIIFGMGVISIFVAAYMFATAF